MPDNKIKSFTDLKAWQEAHKLVLYIHEITKKFPREEQFGLTNQLRRAVVSITSNIAEGFGRHSSKERVQFYVMARGSLAEVQNQLVTAHDVKYIDPDTFMDINSQSILVSKILNGLIKSSRTLNSRF